MEEMADFSWRGGEMANPTVVKYDPYKDFSSELGMVIGKLKVVRDWFDFNIVQENDSNEIWGCFSLLENVIDDFERINKGLYGSPVHTEE